MQLNGKNIVWLASYPKSGNTWFRLFLSNVFSRSDDPVSINNIHDTKLASSRLQFDDLIGTSSSDLSQSEIENLRPLAYHKIAKETIDTAFIKVHDAWKSTSTGDSMFPDEITKGVLYFIRNPLDVAVSFSYHSSKPIDIIVNQMNSDSFTLCNNPKTLFNQLRQELFDWSGHVESWIDHSGLSVHIIRYEDMLNDTYNTFKSALEFTGIQKTPTEIKAAIRASDFNILSQMEHEEGFKEKPISMGSFFRTGKSGEWHKYLSNSNISSIIGKHWKIMNRFGYNTESIESSIF